MLIWLIAVVILAVVLYLLGLTRWSQLYDAALVAGGTREARRLMLWTAVVVAIGVIIRVWIRLH